MRERALVCPHCGTHLKPNYAGALILLIIGLMIVVIIEQTPPRAPETNTAAVIIAAHRACEAQTGQECD